MPGTPPRRRWGASWRNGRRRRRRSAVAPRIRVSMRRPLPILRTRLLWVAVAALVPVLGGSAVLSALLVLRQDDAQLESVLARNRTLISAIDAQMAGHLGRLGVLAASPLLAQGDLAEFGRYAARV